ncbi:hypothetical protein EJB05_53561 [Eragrostis curvula]|uniref:Ribosomal RNA-processing protein 42 n=1 Tax=Eragrostis curvula TaxID=38414 RepID=A0A5J9SPP2_9POAL|nr:hypothetical protein EJB05_53561 [Eragrostis curvula]
MIQLMQRLYIYCPHQGLCFHATKQISAKRVLVLPLTSMVKRLQMSSALMILFLLYTSLQIQDDEHAVHVSLNGSSLLTPRPAAARALLPLLLSPPATASCPQRSSFILHCVGDETELFPGPSFDFPLLVRSNKMVGLSEGEKHFIRGGIAQDIRTDGRRRLQFRALSVETGVIPQANGSARVRLGGTEVIASVKAELGKPSILHPEKGKVNIFVDCSPTAEPMFEGRGSEELSAELSVSLQRCLLGGKSGAGAAIDLSSLIVVDGKVCWDLYIDGLVISSDGNLLDALAAAIKVALSDTGIPKVNVSLSAASDDEPEVDVSDEEFLQFDTSSVPVIITLTKVGRQYIVDATSEEESQMSSAVSVSVNRHGNICGLTKRGGAGLDPSVIFDMISVAKHVSQQFISLLDSEIAAAQADDE